MDLLKKIKIELWVLCLLPVLFFIFMIVFGSLVRHELLAPISRFPNLSGVAMFISEIPSNLRDIMNGPSGASSAGNRFPNISEFDGEPLKEEAYLLLSKYDGNIERSVVELIDLRSFEVKKSWSPDIDQINALVDTSSPEFEHLHRDHPPTRYGIIHPFLTEDGGLIFKSSHTPLVKIDRNSQLVWQNQEDAFHHSIEQDYEGNFWVPATVYPYKAYRHYIGADYGNYDDDAITKVSPDGEILFQKSVTNIFIENDLKFLFYTPPDDEKFVKDALHLNDIQPVMADGPYWKRGDVFISMRTLSMIMLYRPSTNKVMWLGLGRTAAQHDVDILDDHRIYIFNNNARNLFGGNQVDVSNEIVIYDFKTDSYSKYLNESLKQNQVTTLTNGLSQILSNGDLFIEETNYGRLLYFNKDKSLQWQYVNRTDDENVYLLHWSRIFYKPKDINKIHKILQIEN